MGREVRQNVHIDSLLSCTLVVGLDLGLTSAQLGRIPKTACIGHGMEDYKNQEFVLFALLDVERVLHIELLIYDH